MFPSNFHVVIDFDIPAVTGTVVHNVHGVFANSVFLKLANIHEWSIKRIIFKPKTYHFKVVGGHVLYLSIGKGSFSMPLINVVRIYEQETSKTIWHRDNGVNTIIGIKQGTGLSYTFGGGTHGVKIGEDNVIRMGMVKVWGGQFIKLKSGCVACPANNRLVIFFGSEEISIDLQDVDEVYEKGGSGKRIYP